MARPVMLMRHPLVHLKKPRAQRVELTLDRTLFAWTEPLESACYSGWHCVVVDMPRLADCTGKVSRWKQLLNA